MRTDPPGSRRRADRSLRGPYNSWPPRSRQYSGRRDRTTARPRNALPRSRPTTRTTAARTTCSVSADSSVLVPAVVLEGDGEPDAEVHDAAVADRDVLTDDLGDAQVADGLRGGVDRGLGRRLPRI